MRLRIGVSMVAACLVLMISCSKEPPDNMQDRNHGSLSLKASVDQNGADHSDSQYASGPARVRCDSATALPLPPPAPSPGCLISGPGGTSVEQPGGAFQTTGPGKIMLQCEGGRPPEQCSATATW